MFERTQKPTGDDRVSDLDRQRAIARLEQLEDEGIVRGDEELKLRLRKVRLAINQRQLEVAFEGLRAEAPKLKPGDLRASDADRKDAIRRLEAHGALGHLSGDELTLRLELAKASKTPNDISSIFADLPELAASSRSAEPRVSTREREEAISFLGEAHDNGQLDENERDAAIAQVHAARTRGEIEAAFHGLSIPSRTVARKRASDATQQTAGIVAEGGRRLGKAFLRGMLSLGALAIGVILLIAGTGTAAVVCFVVSVMLFVAAGLALVTSR